MIDLPQATSIADRWINGSRQEHDRREIGVYEFARGFVFWELNPPQADPSRPPESVGAGCIVVDRETGEPTFWPPLPALLIAQRYGQD